MSGGDLPEGRLGHDTHNLIENIRSSHGRKLSVSVIRRSDLNDVRGYDVEAIETPQDGAQLASRPAACFGSASRRCKSRVDGVNING